MLIPFNPLSSPPPPPERAHVVPRAPVHQPHAGPQMLFAACLGKLRDKLERKGRGQIQTAPSWTVPCCIIKEKQSRSRRWNLLRWGEHARGWYGDDWTHTEQRASSVQAAWWGACWGLGAWLHNWELLNKALAARWLWNCLVFFFPLQSWGMKERIKMLPLVRKWGKELKSLVLNLRWLNFS